MQVTNDTTIYILNYKKTFKKKLNTYMTCKIVLTISVIIVSVKKIRIKN